VLCVPGVGVLPIELLGVICGVMGVSVLGLAIVDAPKARVWELSRRRLGASLILGCVWHFDNISMVHIDIRCCHLLYTRA